MPEPPAHLLAIRSSLAQLLLLVHTHANRAATFAVDKAYLSTAAANLSRALAPIDSLIALYRSQD